MSTKDFMENPQLTWFLNYVSIIKILFHPAENLSKEVPYPHTHLLPACMDVNKVRAKGYAIQANYEWVSFFTFTIHPPRLLNSF
jgi:hypothetical protein